MAAQRGLLVTNCNFPFRKADNRLAAKPTPPITIRELLPLRDVTSGHTHLIIPRETQHCYSEHRLDNKLQCDIDMEQQES